MEINKLKQASLDAHLRALAKGSTSLDAGRHSDGQGLYLSVSDTGACSWVFMWKVNGKRREMGLGSFSGQGSAFRLSLADARAKADAVRVSLRTGNDPLAAKAEAKLAARAIFRLVLAEFLAKVPALKGWKQAADGTFEQVAAWEQSFEKHAAVLLDTPVDDVDTTLVLSVLTPLWGRKIGEDIRNRIEQVLDYAKGHGHRKGMDNAAAWKGNLSAALIAKPSKKRAESHAAMAADAVPAYAQLIASHSGMSAKALLLVILTAVRSDEAREARWSEFDLDAARWTIPAERMKANAEHIVPLSTQAVELLRSIVRIEGNDFVFASASGNKPINQTALRDKLQERVKDATVHGFRSTFRDWAGDTLHGFDAQDFEFCLAHGLDAVEGAYRRSTAVEKRRRIMQAWANFCFGVEAGVVVNLRAA